VVNDDQGPTDVRETAPDTALVRATLGGDEGAFAVLVGVGGAVGILVGLTVAD
jgi:hypothetical protein